MVFLLLLAHPNLQAQKQELSVSPVKILLLKKPVESEINPHKTDTYTIKLKWAVRQRSHYDHVIIRIRPGKPEETLVDDCGGCDTGSATMRLAEFSRA